MFANWSLTSHAIRHIRADIVVKQKLLGVFPFRGSNKFCIKDWSLLLHIDNIQTSLLLRGIIEVPINMVKPIFFVKINLEDGSQEFFNPIICYCQRSLVGETIDVVRH